jgi:hypothetical protein
VKRAPEEIPKGKSLERGMRNSRRMGTGKEKGKATEK